MKQILLLISLLPLLACTSLQKDNNGTVIDARPVESAAVAESLKVVTLELEGVESHEEFSDDEKAAPVSRKKVEAQKKPPKFTYTMIPQSPNRITKKWITYYSKKGRKRFQRFLNRGSQYKTVIQQLLVDHGLPPDLYYLGILESGFSTNAVSHAGAVGSWQFMRPTGRQYGLAINYYVDERLDPMRSTVAAIRYLKELYRQFGSWGLALAAYNAGPGRVKRAVRRGGTKNYWRLSRRRLLPRDTRHYVPQFLAILTIGSNPQKYGFHEKAPVVIPPIRLVNVPSPVKLQDIAKTCEVPLKKLKKVNPHLTRGVTPPHKKSYDIWVPKAHVVKAIAKKPALKAKLIKGLKIRRYVAKRRPSRYHRVRRGQTLGGIARRYGKSVRSLKRINGLKSSRIYVGQKLKISGSRKIRRVAKAKRKRIRYRIRRGDNLTKIARKFNTTVRRLKRINNLRSSRIMKGQVITIAAN